jgi:hypothetical protein
VLQEILNPLEEIKENSLHFGHVTSKEKEIALKKYFNVKS